MGLGTVLGGILERSGGADVLVEKLTGRFGERGAPIAMGLTGLIFGIPVFFDIGIFVLAPLVYIAALRLAQGSATVALVTAGPRPRTAQCVLRVRVVPDAARLIGVLEV